MRLRAVSLRVVDGCEHGDQTRQERHNRISESRRMTQARHNEFSVCLRTVADEGDVIRHQPGSHHRIEQIRGPRHNRLANLTAILEEGAVHIAAPCVDPRRNARTQEGG
jgi:hypothetical protein